MTSYNKIKILIVGDSGVGKTAFVNLLCYKNVLTNPNWTIGTQIELLSHDYQAGTSNESNYIVELWDVGGYKTHRSSRSIFYHNADGVILMYDITNKKSEQNLQNWLYEILDVNEDIKYDLNMDTISISSFDQTNTSSNSSNYSSQHPILIVGTHFDGNIEPVISDSLPTLQESINCITTSAESKSYCGFFAFNNKFEEIILSNRHASSLTAGCTNSVMIYRFFDRVISRKLYSLSQTNFSQSQSPQSNYTNNRTDQYMSRRHVAIKLDKSF